MSQPFSISQHNSTEFYKNTSLHTEEHMRAPTTAKLSPSIYTHAGLMVDSKMLPNAGPHTSALEASQTDTGVDTFTNGGASALEIVMPTPAPLSP
jgi:hypothetical protein